MNEIKLSHVGFSNYIASNRIVAMSTNNSAPIRRAVKEAQEKSSVIDLTNGRKIKAVIFTDCNSIVLSALGTETIAMRIQEDK